jgi:VanW like protein
MLKYIFLLLLIFCLLPLTSVAGDFVTPLSEFTGVKHELTSQLMIDADAVISHIRGFDEVYDVTVSDKTYQWSRIQRETVDTTKALIRSPQREWDDLSAFNTLVAVQLRNIRIHNIISNYTRYVSDRYIDNYGRCAKQNFMRAFDEFGTIILQPGQTLNINKLLAWLDWYCTWGSDDGEAGRVYMFYQWVCGFSTQVWRNALINPYLETTRRQNHGNRRQAYYGTEIVWDDAAIYEMDKQLEIRNGSDLPIYMRTLEVAGKKYLLSVVPKQTDQVVEIRREEIGNLRGRVIRTIKDKTTNKQLDREYYVSQYRGVISGSN